MNWFSECDFTLPHTPPWKSSKSSEEDCCVWNLRQGGAHLLTFLNRNLCLTNWIFLCFCSFSFILSMFVFSNHSPCETSLSIFKHCLWRKFSVESLHTSQLLTSNPSSSLLCWCNRSYIYTWTWPTRWLRKILMTNLGACYFNSKVIIIVSIECRDFLLLIYCVNRSGRYAWRSWWWWVCRE